MTTVTLAYFDDCPNWETVHRDLRQLREETVFTLELRRVSSSQETEQRGVAGIAHRADRRGRDRWSQGRLDLPALRHAVRSSGAPTPEQLLGTR